MKAQPTRIKNGAGFTTKVEAGLGAGRAGAGRRGSWFRTGAAVLGMAAALSMQAQSYYIDFGGGNTTSKGEIPDDPANYWNNLTGTIGSSSTGALSNLVSSMNVTSTIHILMVSRFNGVNENGTQSSLAYPVNATRDSLFGNTEDWSGLSNIFPSFKLSGLASDTTYDLTFYASRTGVSDVRETGYTVTGGNAGFGALDAANNADASVTVSNMTPDGSGEITISMAPTANNNNGNHFTYLGVMRVDAIPPQTPLTFVQEPVSKSVVQLKPATFTAEVSGSPPYFVQWFENGFAVPGANQFSFTIPSAELYMDGWTYSVTVSNLAYSVTSSNAVLTVNSDTNPPVLVSAASYDGQTIRVEFNEVMDFTTWDIGNYQVNGGAVAVGSAILDASGRVVTLTLGSTISGTFTLVVNNVQDFAGNAIAPNSSIVGPVVPIEEQDVLIDFGNTATTLGPAPDDPENYWNNLTSGVGGSDTGELPSLLTVHNAQTTYGLSMISRFNGANGNGTLFSSVFPQNATRDSLFGNTELFSGLTNIFPSFKLTGLNPARQYTFTFYGSRTAVGDNRETGYTLTGANSGFAALNAANNINDTATAAGISPTAAGEITISLAPTANNNNGNHFTYLGVLRMEPYVAPLAFLPPVIENGQIRLEWTGAGVLESAPSISGPWTAVDPAPTSPYLETLVPGENRFYRLKE